MCLWHAVTAYLTATVKRWQQCFVWASSLGMLGTGLIKDFFSIRRYVAECNEGKEFVGWLGIQYKLPKNLVKSPDNVQENHCGAAR